MVAHGVIRLGYNPEFERKREYKTVEPTPEVWGRYYAALAGLRALNAYEHTEWGGPDYGTEVPEPTPTKEVIWLETHDEWLARCRKLQKEVA
jgi:hypothetical protein